MPTRVDPTSPQAPSRVIVRASADLMVRGFAEGIRTYGGMRRAVMMAAIIVANVEHITRSAARTWRYASLEAIPPNEERRPISVKRLADSLDLPFETTRANVNALIDAGLCARTPAGVVMPTEVLESPRVVESNAVLWDAFWLMIAELQAIEFDFSTITGRRDLDSALVVETDFRAELGGAAPRRLVARVTAEFYLNATLAGAIALGRDWQATAVFASVMSINSQDMARDPHAAWIYAQPDTPLPDAIRRPARVSEVARRLGLDKESVRRQCLTLAATGRFEKADGGYLASMAHMQSPLGRRAAMEMTKAFYRMIYDLTALGLRF